MIQPCASDMKVFHGFSKLARLTDTDLFLVFLDRSGKGSYFSTMGFWREAFSTEAHDSGRVSSRQLRDLRMI